MTGRERERECVQILGLGILQFRVYVCVSQCVCVFVCVSMCVGFRGYGLGFRV